MGRPRRPPAEQELTYHVTVRCNDRKFLLADPRLAGLYRAILARYKAKHGFALYAYAIMANHVHLVLRTRHLARAMHDINGYAAMACNRMLQRTGHFWEARYHAVPIRDGDDRHTLATIAYVHANPKTAGIVFRLDDWRRSDFRFYVGLDDANALTTLHPAFLALGRSPRARTRRYRAWAERHREKSASSGPDARRWGTLLFPRIVPVRAPSRAQRRQRRFPWAAWPHDGCSQELVPARFVESWRLSLQP